MFSDGHLDRCLCYGAAFAQTITRGLVAAPLAHVTVLSLTSVTAPLRAPQYATTSTSSWLHSPLQAAAWQSERVTRTGLSPPHEGRDCSQPRSDALENFRASHPCHAAIRGDVCHDPRCCDGRRADKASGPDRGRSAIWRPIPRRLERDPRTANAAHQIIGNSRTGARRTADENPGEISRRIDRQNLQQRAPLTLPNRGEQALRRRRGNRCEKKKQSRDDTGHILLQSDGCLFARERHEWVRWRIGGGCAHPGVSLFLLISAPFD